MLCPKCGWQMKPMNQQRHGRFRDTLYQCRCGLTHLEIAPISRIRHKKPTKAQVVAEKALV